jgi:hypothetical protein
MKIIRLNENEFKMIDNDIEKIIIKKENEDFIRLEENSLNRKFLQISKFKNSDEIELKEINRNSNSSNSSNSLNSSKSLKYEFENYLNEDEKIILEDLKKKSHMRYENQIRLRDNSKYKELIRIKKNFDYLINEKFISNDNKDYIKLINEIEKIENEINLKIFEE